MKQNDFKKLQGNRGDIMREIYVTRQFLEASGAQGNFFEKTKKPFLGMVKGSVYKKFQVCIVLRLARRRDTHKLIHKHIYRYTSK